MRLVHFALSGEMVGGVERYLTTLLETPATALGHAVVYESGERCPIAGPWPSVRADWSAEGPRAIGDAWAAAIPDGVAIMHYPPAPETIAHFSRIGRPFVAFCHDHRWWCPSASRFHFRVARPCMIHASHVACAVRYHALHCGSLRPTAVKGGFTRAAIGREALGTARVILAASAFMRDEAVRHGASPSRTQVLPLPVAPGADATVPDATGPPLVLYASRLTPEKGPFTLLDAFARMRAPARLALAGTGISAAAITEAVTRHPRRASIELLGHLDPAAVRHWTRRARVVAVPSAWPEPFGLVGVEALAEGRPVVACASGGIPEWAREEVGAQTVPAGRADLLAAALDRALAEPVWSQRAETAGIPWVAAHHAPSVHLDRLVAALGAAGLASLNAGE